MARLKTRLSDEHRPYRGSDHRDPVRADLRRNPTRDQLRPAAATAQPQRRPSARPAARRISVNQHGSGTLADRLAAADLLQGKLAAFVARLVRIPPSCAREETLESRGMPCLFLNTERGFGGKPPKKSGFRRHLAGSKMPKEGSKMPRDAFSRRSPVGVSTPERNCFGGPE